MFFNSGRGPLFIKIPLADLLANISVEFSEPNDDNSFVLGRIELNPRDSLKIFCKTDTIFFASIEQFLKTNVESLSRN
jgi:hypothetical protein